MLDTQKIKQFQKKILDRYFLNKRNLPWRDCKNPYWIFVSEVMLQQTQVDRVIPMFLNFIEEVPDFKILTEISGHKLFRLWSGLGFNSRALRLQKSAKIILEKYQGRIPKNREDLLRLPGIGAYTSASILSFVYNLAAPVVDTNIRRVLIWELELDVDIYMGTSVKAKKLLEEVSLMCIPDGRSNDWHHALMDYGAMICTAKSTGIKSFSKQSRFKGSDREVRGRVLKELLKSHIVTLERLQKKFPIKNVVKIVLTLSKEGIIKTTKNGELKII